MDIFKKKNVKLATSLDYKCKVVKSNHASTVKNNSKLLRRTARHKLKQEDKEQIKQLLNIIRGN